MQLADDASLAAAVEDAERWPAARLMVDWDRDGTYSHDLSDLSAWVSTVSWGRAATGELPAAASLVEGSTAATMTATLGGTDQHTGTELIEPTTGLTALGVFGAYHPTSPLWRSPMVHSPCYLEVGLLTDAGWRWVRKFTGTVRSVTVDSASREVTITCLDHADQLRALISLPVYGIYRRDLIASGREGVPWTTNTTWAVDYVFRRNGIYHAPAPRPGAILSITQCGGLAAEIGYANDVPSDPWQGGLTAGSVWTTGPWGGLAAPGYWDHPVPRPFQNYYCTERIRLLPGVGVGISAWAYVGTGANGDGVNSRTLAELFPSSNASGGNLTESIRLVGSNSGRFAFSLLSSGLATQTVFFGTVQAAAWRFVSVYLKVNENATVSLTLRTDGATITTTMNLVATHRQLVWYPLARYVTYYQARTANHQVWLADAAPTSYPDETFTSSAELNRGANELDHIPDVRGEGSWELLQAVAESEYALVGFDEHGDGYYRPRGYGADPTAVAKTITADRALLDLGYSVNVDTIRNTIGIVAQTGYLGVPVAVVDSKDPLEYQAPVGVWEFPVTLLPLAIGPTAQTVPAVTAAQWQAAEYVWGFVAVRASDLTTEVTTGIQVDYVHVTGRTGVVVVRNYSEHPVRFQLPGANGQAALRIAGFEVEPETPQAESIRSVGSVDLYGERSLPLPADPWRQRIEPLRETAGGLLAQLANPLPVVEGVAVIGDPRLQLTDTVRLEDPRGVGGFRAYVVKADGELSRSSGYREQLAVKPVAPPGLGIWDDAELGLWDATLILAP